MKSLFIVLITLITLASCETRHNVRILETGERAKVEDSMDLYAPGDTIIVTYSTAWNEWQIDRNWYKITGNSYTPSLGMSYKKAVIE